MQDPWVLPSLCELVEGHANVELDMSLSTVEVTYQDIQRTTTNPNQTLIKLSNGANDSSNKVTDQKL